MSAPAVVLTKDEYDAIMSRLDSLEQLVKGGATAAAPTRAYLTPKDVAKRHGIDDHRVYAACAEGSLIAEKRPHGDTFRYRITAEDADRWYAQHVRAGTNQ